MGTLQIAGGAPQDPAAIDRKVILDFGEPVIVGSLDPVLFSDAGDGPAAGVLFLRKGDEVGITGAVDDRASILFG